MPGELKAVVFGGGCFWCTEAVFARLHGVDSVIPGYAGGKTENPSYAAVATGKTGHAEVIKVEYDPAVIKFTKLLEVFFSAHDPTTPDRQGADIGPQYRSVIFFTQEDQKQEAERYIVELEERKKYSGPIVTAIRELERFWPAEEYHQNFYARNPGEPYSQAVIKPKMQKIEQEYEDLLNAQREA